MTTATKARRPARRAEDRIDLRVPSETKELIERAASIIGTTMSQFVTLKAYEAAKEVLREHQVWKLTSSESKAFVDLLTNPPAPTEALREAFASHERRVSKA